MKKTTIYCDGCGKELNLFNGVTDMVLEIGFKQIKIDLCSDCIEVLQEQIKEFCKNGNPKIEDSEDSD